ncbi:chloride channel protein [Kaistia algarum]|uniref:chloride channel protein n=1 Tax=Kaistia algarum TaxID=2083279 RepID=UPI000CE89B8D|nr:chloride channel protein [Kaistia algarum]MCX5514615.1 chloride channel protein [Kaistia algarum]PPE79012.1 chloride channel protein [Kaistia algarum]
MIAQSLLDWLKPRARARARSSEPWFLIVAAVIGVIGGAVAAGIGSVAQLLHEFLFAIPPEARLSAIPAIEPVWRCGFPLVGGMLMGVILYIFRKPRPPIVDPIEANALRGGQMSLGDSLRVGLENVVSNGFGASVGLEAGYTQVSSGIASTIGMRLGLRRTDLRLAVGCGSAAAIAGAFGAPLAGAFYGFELIIGVYSVANVAPVLTAAICGFLTARGLGMEQHFISIPGDFHVEASAYAPYLALGVLLGLVAIGIMRLISLVEQAFQTSGLPRFVRPVIGGAAVSLMALVTPQAISGGHGALYLNLAETTSLSALALVILAKVAATSTSIGAGFRGGMFFASLFLGVLCGKFFGMVMALAFPAHALDPTVTAIVGMSALSVGVIGGPLTMTFLALEATGDLAITGIVLAASILSAITVRQLFGYSFSTWRLHLRGETIRGAQDIGLLRDLTVGRMMRTDVRMVLSTLRLDGFRSAFPLGSAQRVVVTDPVGTYAGIILVSDAHAANGDDEATVDALCRYRKDCLTPEMSAKEAARSFDAAESEELAVVDDPTHRHVIGLLTEAHLLRRYAEELDKARRDLSGEV